MEAFAPINLRKLVAGLVYASDVPDVTVTAVRDDSRTVQPGDVFVALAGNKDDGRRYVAHALSRGAKVIVSDARGAEQQALAEETRAHGVALLVVRNARVVLGHMLARGYGAVERLRMLAVTGTNGKTTTTYLVESILQAAGRSPGVFGTVEYRYAGHREPAPLTTPGSTLLHGWLARMAAAGCTDVVLEASSHALAQDRLAGCLFDVAALTNVTQDHLDYHGTMHAYFDAKARLFVDYLTPNGVGVLFIDRDDGRQMAARLSGQVLKLSVAQEHAGAADIWVSNRRLDGQGMVATFHTPKGTFDVHSKLVGDYNLANVTLAVGMAYAHGLPLDALAQGVQNLPGVPGRLEPVPNQAGVLCVVDYAHTPDALERAMGALRPLTRGRLIVVFGCGGDRDPTKRPLMGAAVAALADVAILTSDNPRTEDPVRILDMVKMGMQQGRLPERLGADVAQGGFCVQADRRAAIALAVGVAAPGDVLLIAGKGHEDYQIIGTVKHHFDDREEAAAAFASAGAR
ncbi:MAG: UDP-N-acetylmuramoyl-L-alanyl-D-glutamate--2,6-diaminopimelate ligase [Deltaproteobacteria bacterium]|nr:UDP-N-acetylmuramoyl-L-alanyl-D-glutamate--2,6-diaminopimelate ligase [Deltaproteobacteria bacterium]